MTEKIGMSAGKGLHVKVRQRRFSLEGALSRALMTFLEVGFDGASITQLTEAMGIARPSLYAAFGNKDGLFREAMALYQRKRLDYIRTALAKPEFRLVVDDLMRGARAASTLDLPCSALSEFALGGARDIAQEAFAREQIIRKLLAERISVAMEVGEITTSADQEGLAACLIALTDSVALRSRAGGSEEDIAAMVEAGRAIWQARRE